MAIPRFPVEAGHVLTFARALGETAERYSDDSFGADGLAGAVAPPTFVQSGAQFDPQYSLRPQPGQPWAGRPAAADAGADGTSAPAATGGQHKLHAEQRFEFVRPVRVGDVLTAIQRPGATWDRHGKKGGRLVFTELITEYRDSSGQLVVTATAVAVATERLPGEAGATS